ncbi:MAG: InlB B-repeat-containing protein, partial [Lachnospiraceae bacterium]|nr:InlB B-repeat-containing protein [Lachnospiraceae bacterium]
TFCGFPIKSDTICYNRYHNGWQAYCADCGELVSETLFYAKSTTVSEIISMSADAWYVYICPYCQGLEQGRKYDHTCKAISNNCYDVLYHANVPENGVTVKGVMAPTGHMYNNAVMYNGVSASELGYNDTHLRENGYSCDGYKFTGWNTRPDGSGSFYADRAEVLNLTTEDKGSVVLYAQWEKIKITPPTLYTRQLELEESEFVYRESERTYYVKADNVTEHKLLVRAYMEDASAQNFQIDSMYIHIGENDSAYLEWLQVIIPLADVGESSVCYTNEELGNRVSAKCQEFLNPGSIWAERSGHGVELALEQSFSVGGARGVFVLYPQAAAGLHGQQYYSEESKDKVNGITIIPDGTPPIIEGLDELAAFDILDITDQTKYFELKAEDNGSGLKEFMICVSNKDNFMEEEFLCDSQGRILLEMDKDNTLFMGEIVISAVAVDRVGNANIIGEDGLTFTLETELYKERKPEETVFKTGDSAVLKIMSMGYVEKLEVIIPDELLQLEPELPLVFEYESPYLQSAETIRFRIPLGIPEQEYEIAVKAYKNGEMLVSKQTLVVVKGSVLDELRTRIRSNG